MPWRAIKPPRAWSQIGASSPPQRRQVSASQRFSWPCRLRPSARSSSAAAAASVKGGGERGLQLLLPLGVQDVQGAGAWTAGDRRGRRGWPVGHLLRGDVGEGQPDEAVVLPNLQRIAWVGGMVAQFHLRADERVGAEVADPVEGDQGGLVHAALHAQQEGGVEPDRVHRA
ncbi:MAG: hypothetical protein ACRDYD_00010 [Acidimicrobiales bacterium]